MNIEVTSKPLVDADCSIGELVRYSEQLNLAIRDQTENVFDFLTDDNGQLEEKDRFKLLFCYREAAIRNRIITDYALMIRESANQLDKLFNHLWRIRAETHADSLDECAAQQDGEAESVMYAFRMLPVEKKHQFIGFLHGLLNEEDISTSKQTA